MEGGYVELKQVNTGLYKLVYRQFYFCLYF